MDKAVLITGDSDFVPAVNVAKEEGIVTILYYSKKRVLYVHNELLECCDETYEITQEIINASHP
ncbi:MAG: NYN domain-containing protein [Candidatus Bathyarchaeum tardum]|nr:MAG: NYN domain-containing protein [Candidatus Bathyarchaeum tardum]